MVSLAGLAARNLTRNLRRTFITSIAVVFGVAVMILGFGVVNGLDENVIRTARTTTTGDLLLRPKDYPTDGLTWPAEEAQTVPPEVLQAIDGHGVATARVVFSGRVVHGADGVRALIVGYDPATETKVFDHAAWKVEGAWPTDTEPGAAIGERLAEILGVKLGDDLVVEARTRAGALNAMTYRVTALLSTSNTQLDAFSVWLPTPAADDLGRLEGTRSHVAVKLDHPNADAAAVAAAAEGAGWTATSDRESVTDMLQANDIRRRALTVLVIMIMLIAAAGIANTVIMAAFERVREVGTLLSLGMRKLDVAALFLYEGAAMGTFAGLAGAALGAALVLHWNTHGIDLSGVLKQTGGNFTMSAVLFTAFSWPSVVASFACGVVIAVLASVYPAWTAANLNPADAVRAD